MRVSDPEQGKATQKQIDFIILLLNDAGYDTRIKYLSYVNGRLDRAVAHLEELTMKEASMLIEELKGDLDMNLDMEETDNDLW